MQREKHKQISGPELFQLFKDFSNCSLSYVYKGIFDPNLTDKILALSETNMNLTEENSKTQKRVYFVMVESLQNITRHQDLSQEEENHAFFVVQNKPGEYQLTSANIIQNSKIAELSESISKINSLDADQLKEYYKHVLENTGLSDKGGAGLGLIEMARKSGNKLSCSFDACGEDSSFFYFKTRVTGQTATETTASIDAEKKLHAFSREQHINMIYQGIFTQENLKSLLTMTEGSVAAKENLSFKRKVVSILVELLQNICKHSADLSDFPEGNPGIIIVATGKEGCSLYSGNYVLNSKTKIIEDKIQKVNNCAPEDLEEMYSAQIMKDIEPGQKGAGLGFIDIKMKSGTDISWSIEAFNSEYSFLTLNAFIPF